jgi:hypothetical protein
MLAGRDEPAFVIVSVPPFAIKGLKSKKNCPPAYSKFDAVPGLVQIILISHSRVFTF